MGYFDCFHTRAKCAIWIIIWIVQFEWSFELQYFGPCIRQITSRCIIWNVQFKWRPEVFSSYASLKSRSEIAVSMPWPLNWDFEAELHDLLTTSTYIPRAAYVQKHIKCELRACLIGRVPRHLLPLWNVKPQSWSLVCTLRNSNIAITSLVCTLRNSNCAIRMIIQIALFALVWNESWILLYPKIWDKRWLFCYEIKICFDWLVFFQLGGMAMGKGHSQSNWKRKLGTWTHSQVYKPLF